MEDEFSEEFEARLEAELEHIEEMIVAGDLAFIVGDQGVLSLLEQHDLEGLTAIDDAHEGRFFDDDEMSLNNLLLVVGRGGASEAVEIHADAVP